ncbi:uncharacterized protein METZ01_LOCUS112442, partial [marine metagenome]
MECVTQCPDTAILGKAIPESQLNDTVEKLESGEIKGWISEQWADTNKFSKVPEKQGKEPAKFGIFIDPTKCKGCAECVDACGDHEALSMIPKSDNTIPLYQEAFDFFTSLGDTPSEYINERVLVDMMLASDSLLYTGGAGSCMGCGEGSALRMMLAATGFVYGKESIGIVAATG